MANYNERIVVLLGLYMTGGITPEERLELDAWCADEPRNRAFFDALRNEERLAGELPLYLRVDERKAWEKFRRRTRLQSPAKPRRIVLTPVWKYISAIAVAAAVVWGIREIGSFGGRDVLYAESGVTVGPGSTRAVLVTGGRCVELGGNRPGEVVEHDGITATSTAEGLVYDKPQAGPARIIYDELRIPRGGEYRVTLPDGTRIYLKSSTTLRYPVTFSKGERRVVLSGDAYFSVAKDASRPFIVETEGVETKAYGTSFNINTLRRNCIETVLIEGSVGVRDTRSGRESMIEPGQLARFDRSAGTVEVVATDIGLITDWEQGVFRFENQSLEDILSALSDWYDINMTFRDASLRGLHFSGYLDRYEDIGVILDAISLATGAKFYVRDRGIIVSK